MRAFQSEHGGKLLFSEQAARIEGVFRELFVKCGQCVGCRLERSRQWATRCMHEASLHDVNSFVTLTYDEAHLPVDRGLHYREFQLWLKRLRKQKPNEDLRFYMCGEYGDDNLRPHFHAILFGIDFPDKVPIRKLADHKIYRSALLERTWPFGFSSIGSVTFESCAYVARYCMKKVTGYLADAHYRYVDADGVVHDRAPEFNRMSNGGRTRKGGIGAEWFRRFQSDVYPDGRCVVRGALSNSPRYYDKLAEIAIPDDFESAQHKKYLRSLSDSYEKSDERLAVKERVALARVNLLKRSL